MDKPAAYKPQPAIKSPREVLPAPTKQKRKSSKRQKRRTPEEIAHDNWYERIKGRLDSITGGAVVDGRTYQHKETITVIDEETLRITADVIDEALDHPTTALHLRHRNTLRRFARILRRRAGKR